MYKAIHSGLASAARKPGRTGVVNQLEGLSSGFLQDADAVDQRIVAGEKGWQHRLVADPNIQRYDLPDITERLKVLSRLGIAAADGDDFAAGSEPLDDISADEARPTEYRSPPISHGPPRLGAAGWRAESPHSITRQRPATQGTVR
jgi:hypothetical protein